MQVMSMMHGFLVLRDIFICGLPKGPIKDRLFEEKSDTLTFEKAIEIAGNKEASCKRSQEVVIKKETEEEVYQLRGRRRTFYKGERDGTSSKSEGNGNRPNQSKSQGVGANAEKCNCEVCGKVHPPPCRYRNCVCRRCGVKGHLAVRCFKNIVNNSRSGWKNRNNYLETENDDNGELCNLNDDHFDLFNINEFSLEPILINISVNNKMFEFELDTGASVSVISNRFRTANFKEYLLESTDKTLRTYDGNSLKP